MDIRDRHSSWQGGNSRRAGGWLAGTTPHSRFATRAGEGGGAMICASPLALSRCPRRFHLNEQTPCRHAHREHVSLQTTPSAPASGGRCPSQGGQQAVRGRRATPLRPLVPDAPQHHSRLAQDPTDSRLGRRARATDNSPGLPIPPSRLPRALVVSPRPRELSPFPVARGLRRPASLRYGLPA